MATCDGEDETCEELNRLFNYKSRMSVDLHFINLKNTILETFDLHRYT